MKLAIVVVTYQAERYLDGLFATLKQHTELDDIAVVVVDNASSDGTLGRAVSHRPRLARPRGAAADEKYPALRKEQHRPALGAPARSRLSALLLNQDIEVTPGWLKPLLSVMETRPEVAAAQPPGRAIQRAPSGQHRGQPVDFCGFRLLRRLPPSHRQPPLRRAARSWPLPQGRPSCCAWMPWRNRRLRRESSSSITRTAICRFALRLAWLRLRAGADVARSAQVHRAVLGAQYALLDRNRWWFCSRTGPWARLAVAGASPGRGRAGRAGVVAARQGWLRGKTGQLRGNPASLAGGGA